MKSNVKWELYFLDENQTIRETKIFYMGELYPSRSIPIIVILYGLVFICDDNQHDTTNTRA